MLEYEFFRNALYGILIISVASAVIGTYIYARRMVSIAGGVTHACFGGLGLGYFLGINPIVMAGAFAVGSSMGVDWLSSRHRVREDSAIAVIWSIGMALGVIFVFLTPGYVPELNSFLFGNILTITRGDLVGFLIFTALLLLYISLNFRKVIICAFDRDFAKVSGLRVNLVRAVMTAFTAICIVLTIRLVGVMLLMSMFSLPQMIAETRFHRVKPLMIASSVVSAFCCLVGLFLACYIDVPCSALIVMVMAFAFLLARTINYLAFRNRLD